MSFMLKRKSRSVCSITANLVSKKKPFALIAKILSQHGYVYHAKNLTACPALKNIMQKAKNVCIDGLLSQHCTDGQGLPRLLLYAVSAGRQTSKSEQSSLVQIVAVTRFVKFVLKRFIKVRLERITSIVCL